jgi:hypothetical protein
MTYVDKEKFMASPLGQVKALGFGGKNTSKMAVNYRVTFHNIQIGA